MKRLAFIAGPLLALGVAVGVFVGVDRALSGDETSTPEIPATEEHPGCERIITVDGNPQCVYPWGVVSPPGGPDWPPLPPTPAPTCVPVTVRDTTVCLPPESLPRPDTCAPITFQGRTGCLPPGALYSSVGAGPDAIWSIYVGNSAVRFTQGKLLEWDVVPEDEAAFAELRELFQP